MPMRLEGPPGAFPVAYVSLEAVIYGDATSEGDAREIESMFASRRADVEETGNAATWLRQLLAQDLNGQGLALALQEKAAELEERRDAILVEEGTSAADAAALLARSGNRQGFRENLLRHVPAPGASTTAQREHLAVFQERLEEMYRRGLRQLTPPTAPSSFEGAPEGGDR
jgi:hypothetical protein